MGLLTSLMSKFSKGPAIQNIENVDMVITMKDGGIVMPIICSQHLDDSEEIFILLRKKISNYLKSLDMPAFQNEFPRRDYIKIKLSCIKKPAQRVLDELELLNDQYKSTPISFFWES